MDHVQQVYFELKFRIAFLESKGDEFQRLFEKLMLKVHQSDFMACRPWDNVGDRKNDGYLPSERILFQSYAPNDMSAAKAIKEIIDEWTFVHNAPDGRLGLDIIKALAKLRKESPEIRIGHCGYEELLTKFCPLSLPDLESWFGPSLSMEATIKVAGKVFGGHANRDWLSAVIAPLLRQASALVHESWAYLMNKFSQDYEELHFEGS